MEMYKKTIAYLKKILNNKDKKKLIENSIIVIIIGVIIIIAGGSFFKKNNNDSIQSSLSQNNRIEVSSGPSNIEDKNDMESKLEVILSKIEGVGKVNVMITYVSGQEIIPAYDTRTSGSDTQEKDSSGGTRDITQSTHESTIAYQQGEGGTRKPIVIKDLYPVVKGVVVVADGASDPRVRDSISRAVQALVDIPIHKIQVFERNK